MKLQVVGAFGWLEVPEVADGVPECSLRAPERAVWVLEWRCAVPDRMFEVPELLCVLQ